MADEDLSDDQIRHLLQDAEQRLRRTKQSQEIQPQDTSLLKGYLSYLSPSYDYSDLRISLCEIAPEKSIVSYIKNTDKGAQINSLYLVNDKERKLSNVVRIVQDPIAVPKIAPHVSLSSFFAVCISSMRKIYPKTT
jgi:hypothetical protein